MTPETWSKSAARLPPEPKLRQKRSDLNVYRSVIHASWRKQPITRNIKRRPLFAVSLSRRNSLTEKERLYESREVYRDGRACRHHFRCGEECGGPAAHGMRAGNQSSHDSGVHSRTAWNAGVDLAQRNLGDLVTRSAKAPCQPASGLRSA